MIWGRLEGSQGSFWAGDGVKLVGGWKAALKAAVWCRPEETWQGVGSGSQTAAAGSRFLWVGRGSPKTLIPRHRGQVPALLLEEDDIFIIFMYLFFFFFQARGIRGADELQEEGPASPRHRCLLASAAAEPLLR